MEELRSSYVFKEHDKVGQEGFFSPIEISRLKIFSEITATMHALAINEKDTNISYFMYATSASGKLLAGQRGRTADYTATTKHLQNALRQMGDELHMYVVSMLSTPDPRYVEPGQPLIQLCMYEESRTERARSGAWRLLDPDQRKAKGIAVHPMFPLLAIDTWHAHLDEEGWFLLNDRQGKPVPAVKKETCVRFTPTPDWRTANALGQFAGRSQSPHKATVSMERADGVEIITLEAGTKAALEADIWKTLESAAPGLIRYSFATETELAGGPSDGGKAYVVQSEVRGATPEEKAYHVMKLVIEGMPDGTMFPHDPRPIFVRPAPRRLFN